jgi:hypothetical protein
MSVVFFVFREKFFVSLLSLFDTMLTFVVNLLENERDPRSGPMNDQDHSLSLSDPFIGPLSFSNKFSTKFSIVSYSL